MVWSVIREPPDRLADVRISLGKKSDIGAYMVFRGEPEEVVDLLKAALKEASRTVLTHKYKDHRGRPQG